MFYAFNNKLKSSKWLDSKRKENENSKKNGKLYVSICDESSTVSVDSNELVKLNTQSGKHTMRAWEMIGISCLTLEFHSIIFQFVN